MSLAHAHWLRGRGSYCFARAQFLCYFCTLVSMFHAMILVFYICFLDHMMSNVAAMATVNKSHDQKVC